MYLSDSELGTHFPEEEEEEDSKLISMGNLDNSPTVQITGTIMVIAIIVLFLVVVFVFLLHLYAKSFWWRTEQPPLRLLPPPRRRRRHAHQLVESSSGLDLSVLASIPIVIYQGSNSELKDGPLECAVCLSEVEQGEKARMLPNCNHGFHVECIDMWFHSHSTCPLCRTSLLLHSSTIDDQSPSFPPTTAHHQVQPPAAAAAASGSCRFSGSTSRPQDAVFVIDVSVAAAAEEENEARTPRPTRLRSLKRLLSMERSKAAPSTTCNDSDEQV